jgi:hypothetical protein
MPFTSTKEDGYVDRTRGEFVHRRGHQVRQPRRQPNADEHRAGHLQPLERSDVAGARRDVDNGGTAPRDPGHESSILDAGGVHDHIDVAYVLIERGIAHTMQVDHAIRPNGITPGSEDDSATSPQQRDNSRPRVAIAAQDQNSHHSLRHIRLRPAIRPADHHDELAATNLDHNLISFDAESPEADPSSALTTAPVKDKGVTMPDIGDDDVIN